MIAWPVEQEAQKASQMNFVKLQSRELAKIICKINDSAKPRKR